MEKFEVKSQPIISGQYEQSVRKYKKIVGKSGIWYIAIQENEASNIYFKNPNEKSKGSFQGFGGATLKFKLEDGTIDEVTGPWHSNSVSLFEDTGYDIRDKHFTFGVISKDIEFEGPKTFMVDVLHKDEDWTLGTFDRIKNKAQEISNKTGEKIYYYSQSVGGSIRSWAEPEN